MERQQKYSNKRPGNLTIMEQTSPRLRRVSSDTGFYSATPTANALVTPNSTTRFVFPTYSMPMTVMLTWPPSIFSTVGMPQREWSPLGGKSIWSPHPVVDMDLIDKLESADSPWLTFILPLTEHSFGGGDYGNQNDGYMGVYTQPVLDPFTGIWYRENVRNIMKKLAEEQSQSTSSTDTDETMVPESPFRQKKEANPICEFCTSNGVSGYLIGHRCKNESGEVECPKLFKVVCPICKATGKKAHTQTHCPKKQRREQRAIELGDKKIECKKSYGFGKK